MSTTTRKNLAVKSLQSMLASLKKHNAQALLEWELSCCTSPARGHVYGQEELKKLYSRDSWNADEGASKICHMVAHNGREFEYIVIKRAKANCWIDEHAYNPDSEQTGNQLIDEINCWLKFAEREESDLLCPIMRYYTSKSDRVSPTSRTMLDNVIIIAQKAVYVSVASECCQEAERLNRLHGLSGDSTIDRLYKMRAFSYSQGWRDVLKNPGNCGVIYDYHSNCYKAVFIDYAL